MPHNDWFVYKWMTLFISVQSIHSFRLLNWEGIQLSYINNLQSSDIPKEFEAHFCYTEIVFHFALMWFVSPGSDFPIMYQRLDSRNGLLKEGKRIYLTWIKIGSSSPVKLWITFKLQSRIAFHREQLQLIVMPFISMMIRSQKGRVQLSRKTSYESRELDFWNLFMAPIGWLFWWKNRSLQFMR